MATIRTLEPIKQALKTKSKVAAYARVSKDSENLIRSFANQVKYYTDYIKANPEWDFVEVYSDEYISGTRIFNRPGFNRMVEDAKAGKFEILLVKSISRFSRNTVDCLKVIRMLSEIGVEIRFEKESINTASGEGELMLTLLASLAQEEVQSLSTNVQWSIHNNFKEGKIANLRLLGYENVDGKLVVDHDSSLVVRRIFREYLEGKSAGEIASRLNRGGYKTSKGNEFDAGAIIHILTNITYTGDLLLQKTKVIDPISHKKIRNKGEYPQYYVRDDHEGIIDREIFEKVQKLYKERSEMGSGHQRTAKTTIFYQKIVCGKCGCNYVHGKAKCKNGYVSEYYYCGCRQQKKPVCHNCQISRETIEYCFARLMDLKEFDEDVFLDKVKRIVVTRDEPLRFVFKNGSYKEIKWRRRVKHAEGYRDTCQ